MTDQEKKILEAAKKAGIEVSKFNLYSVDLVNIETLKRFVELMEEE